MAHDRLRGLALSVPILLLVGTWPVSAQVAPMTPADSARTSPNAGDNAPKQEEGLRREDPGAQPAANAPPIGDETVGFGGSVDRAPRDSESIDRAPRDIREPFDE